MKKEKYTLYDIFIIMVAILLLIPARIIAVLVGILCTYFVKLVETNKMEILESSLSAESITVNESEKTILDRIVEATTVSDFSGLFSKQNLLAIMIFSILIGIAMNMTGDKAKPFERVLISANEVIMNVLKMDYMFSEEFTQIILMQMVWLKIQEKILAMP